MTHVSLRIGAISAVLAASAWATADTIDFTISLDGDQENPPVDTAGVGFGTATLDLDTGDLTWSVSHQDLTGAPIAAHFHGNAEPCVNAGVLIPVDHTINPIVGSATLTALQMDDIIAGLWYVNIHTAMHGPGEIRGQVVPAALVNPMPDVGPSGVHIVLETVSTGLTAPNWGTNAPGWDDFLFVTDQDGILWRIDLDTGDKEVFLDVTSRLVPLGLFGKGTFDERGLLGIAFHPDYQKNGLLYTYTSEPEDGPADFSTVPIGESPNHQTVIIEWEVPAPADVNSLPGSPRILLRIDQPQFNHDGGAVVFGPDDLLYIALGDGGGADDRDGQPFIGNDLTGHGCEGNGQDTTNPLGAVLRIDPLGNDSANGQYGIPADNPFAGGGAGADVAEIFAWGFRNPFRMSFDTADGTLYVGDVGQNDIEEIDIVVNGGNYGWRHREGSFDFSFNGNQSGYVTDQDLSGPTGLIDPIAEYDHDDGIAIIGGFVYRGTRIPAIEGRYVFGEFAVSFASDGRLFHLDGADIVEFELVGQPALDLSLLGFGQDARGELYALANGTGVPFEKTGVVLRITVIPGDLNADGAVNVLDLLGLLQAFGDVCPQGCAADLNDDGVVNVLDFLILLQNWG